MTAVVADGERRHGPVQLIGMSLDGGRYVFEEVLDHGGMGEVYRARDTHLRRAVAIKRVAPHLHQDPEARELFRREARRSSSLTDPHLAVVHDVIEEGGELFLVMELLSGKTLRARLGELAGRPMPLDEFLSIGIQCARALEAAHAQRIVHCDFKPENVMLTAHGHVKVLDFGLARALPFAPGSSADAPGVAIDSSMPTVPGTEDPGAALGTPYYMAPEALRGAPGTERSDLFSLGVVLYEACTGRHPFRGAGLVDTGDHILHAEVPAASSVATETPHALDPLLARLLAKDPSARPKSAEETRLALSEIARVRPGGQELVAGAIGPPLPRWTSRERLKATLAALVLVVVTVSGTAIALSPALRHGILQRLHIEQPLPPRKLLAVLPFDVVGNDSTGHALADGLTFTLTGQLTRLQVFEGTLQVIPMTEVLNAKVRTPQEARENLGATLAITGSVQRLENGLRVICNVTDPKERGQVRSITRDVPVSGSGLVQDQVALGVADMLEIELKADSRRAFAPKRRGNAQANALYLQGRGYLLSYDDPAQVERARRNFDAAVALDSAYAPAWAGLGDASWVNYQLTKDARWVGRTRSAFERALALEPDLAAAHAGLGALAVGTGLPELGVKELQRALELDPTSDSAYRGIAAAYQSLGQDVKAEEAFRLAITRHPDYWGGYSWLGWFYLRQVRYPEALAMFKRVTELAPLNARGWSNLGGTYMYLNRSAEGIDAVRHSVALRPTSVNCGNLGSLLYYEGHLDEAAIYFKRALELNPDDYHVWGNMADCRRHMPGGASVAQGLYVEAIRRAEQVLLVNPRDAVALASLGEYHANLGHGPEAMRRFQQALQIDPSDPEIMFYGVLICERLGDREGALKYLKQSVDSGYSMVEVRGNPDLSGVRHDPRAASVLAGRG
jgi:tetratricopeptide (TPR) repeat protein